MADIELVIKIDEELYNYMQKGEYDKHLDKRFDYQIRFAVKDGIPLPKGHGKIGDLGKLIRAMKERNDDNGGEPLNAVDRGYDLAFQHMIEESKECVIIEVNKEQTDE